MMVLALVLTAGFVEPPKVTVGRETTYITGPLRADGTVDYVAYVNAPLKEIRPEDNAAVAILRAVGPNKHGKTTNDEFFRLLKTQSLPIEGNYLLTYVDWDFQKSLKEREKTRSDDSERRTKIMLDGDYLQRKLWTRRDKPRLAAWLDESAEPLEWVVEASRRPRCVFPAAVSKEEPWLVGAETYVIFGIWIHQRLALMLAHRALLRGGEGDLAGAYSDLDALHRLAEVIGREPISMVERSSVGAMEGYAVICERLLAQSGKPSLEQLKLRKDVLEGPSATRHEPDLLYRRLRSLDFFCTVGVRGLDKAWPNRLDEWLPADNVFGVRRADLQALGNDKAKSVKAAEAALRRTNEWFDRAERVFAEPNFARRVALSDELRSDLKKHNALEALLEVRQKDDEFGRLFKVDEEAAPARKETKRPPVDLNDLDGLGRRIADGYVSTLGYPIVWQPSDLNRIVFRRQAALACALAADKSRHGRYPERLDAKDLGVKAETLLDPFSEKPFVYRTVNGKRQVVSVGVDQKLNEKPKDDIVLELP